MRHALSCARAAHPRSQQTGLRCVAACCSAAWLCALPFQESPTSPPPRLRPCSLLDWFLGYFLFVFLFFFAFLYFVDKVQGALLFNFKFAKMLEVGGPRGAGPRRPATWGTRRMQAGRHACPAFPPWFPLIDRRCLAFLQRSRLLEANYLTNFVDRAMERNKKVGPGGAEPAACIVRMQHMLRSAAQ